MDGRKEISVFKIHTFDKQGNVLDELAWVARWGIGYKTNDEGDDIYSDGHTKRFNNPTDARKFMDKKITSGYKDTGFEL